MFIDELKEKCKNNIKKIILAESNDIRILKASRIIKDEKYIEPVLIYNDNLYSLAEENNIDISDILIVNKNTFKDIDILINRYYELRKHKGITLEDAKKIVMNNDLVFANMLVETNYYDGVVAGNISSSSDTIRSSLQTIGSKNGASSYFIIELDDKSIGYNGILLYSDCGMIQNPTSEQLVSIAKSSYDSFISLINSTPKIAFLSHSTNNSSKCNDQEKVYNAVKIFKEKYPNIIADGEMQFDCAIDKDVANVKYPNSNIKGDANIMIFPDLDSANIAYKITERLAHAKVYGPIIQGLNKPSNDLSRGTSVESIIGVAIITAIQSINGNV